MKNEQALYVGSETEKYHPARATDDDIHAYIKNPTIKWKKILVVADSLERLIAVMGKEVLSMYCLMIDEIDSFQLDSNYRLRMEDCINIYKTFPKTQRVLVSATLLNFSDPQLGAEEITLIRYDTPTSRQIQLFHRPKKIKSAAVKLIARLTTEFPKVS